MSYSGANDDSTLKGISKEIYDKAKSNSSKSSFRKLKKLLKDK